MMFLLSIKDGGPVPTNNYIYFRYYILKRHTPILLPTIPRELFTHFSTHATLRHNTLIALLLAIGSFISTVSML